MNPELEKKLIAKYPELYSEHDKPPTESLMCFGFECGDGWYDLIDCLSACINHRVDSDIEHEILLRKILTLRKIFVGWRNGWKSKWWWRGVLHNIKRYRYPVDVDFYFVHAVQVKEKFGGLRFYVHNAGDEIHGMISMAEQMSFKICEKCGKPGSLHKRGGWLKTLCTKCAKPIEYKKCKGEN